MHVFITGASSGIGEAFAHEFHKRGGSVSLVARRKQKLDALVGELGDRALAIEADLTNPRDAEAAIAPAEAAFGPIVYPGPVHTDMGDKAIVKYEESLGASLAPWGTSRELAEIVARKVELGGARVVYPRSYAVSLFFPIISRWFSLKFSPKLKPTGV